MSRTEEDEGLVRVVLAAIADMSPREAAEVVGISHERIRQLRSGAWTRFNAATRRDLRAFVETRLAVPTAAAPGYREGLLYAADEMEKKAAEFRALATPEGAGALAGTETASEDETPGKQRRKKPRAGA